jgi:cellulose biosynthesis protein BcsQ
MTLVTSIVNSKYGVVKTTTPINFATILKRRKEPVVIIDSKGNEIISPKVKC